MVKFGWTLQNATVKLSSAFSKFATTSKLNSNLSLVKRSISIEKRKVSIYNCNLWFEKLWSHLSNFFFLFLSKILEFKSYFDKLSYGAQLEISDLEKIFNYSDLFPTHNELSEAKINVMKCKSSNDTRNKVLSLQV